MNVGLLCTIVSRATVLEVVRTRVGHRTIKLLSAIRSYNWQDISLQFISIDTLNSWLNCSRV